MARCRNFRAAPRVTGLLLAVLAIIGQLTFGSIASADDPAGARLAALDAASILCQTAPNPAGSGHAPAPSHRQVHHLLCPLAQALAMPALPLVSGPLFPRPQDHLAGWPVRRAFARGPPAGPGSQIYPTGPPALA